MGNRSKAASKAPSSRRDRQSPEIPPDADATFEILRGRKRRLSRSALHARGDEAVADLIWATCHWGRDWSLGDFRFLVFSTDPSEDVNLYVQFWSEPREEACWEVCSGKWNPPADKVMAGAPSEYVRRLGFEIGGQAENFQRYLAIRRRRDAERVARVVLDVFYDAFGYRGLTSLDVQVGSDNRGDVERVFHAFAPEDLVKTARRIGWTAQIPQTDVEDEDPLIIDVERGVTRARFVMSGLEPGTGTYQSAVVDVGEPLARDRAATRAAVRGASALEEAPLRVGRALHFAGGVTADWLLTQVAAGLELAQSVRLAKAPTVH